MKTSTPHRAICRSCIAACVSAAVCVGGCVMGPDFVRPGSPDVNGYTSTPLPARLTPGDGEAEQSLVVGRAISADWWKLFGSSQLQQVVEQAIAGNRTLVAARATLAQARQSVAQARSAYYPQIDVAANLKGEADIFTLGPIVSYVPDVFGATRRTVEQHEALAENQRYQVAAVYLTLTGNAVSQAINIASARMQLSAAEDIVSQDERNLALVRQKLEAGKVARADFLIAESLLENDRTQLAPLRQQLSVARHALSVLVGKFPAQWTPPDFDLTRLDLPAQLPVSLPSELAHQRPDILAAEAQLHAASAQIGVAVARMYPSIDLSVAGGIEGTNAGFTLASGVLAPVFHGGGLKAQKQAAIEAFGQVADTLRALEHDAELVDTERRALDTSSESLALQQLMYNVGKSDLLSLLAAERNYQQARLGYARALAQRYLDTVQLFVALGGGWWNAKEPVASAKPGLVKR